jgi:DNA-binding transcriptional LysR family regulator
MNLRFDLRTLQIFIAVVELESITRAAERHNIAASAVSKRVADLEEALAVPLLTRLPRGVEPTAAGAALLVHAKAILNSVERLVGELGDYAGGAKGLVRLLVNKSAIVQFLPEDLRSFANRYPDIRIDLEEENSATILKGVADGSADLGVFTVGAGFPDDLQTFPYRRDRLVVLVPREHVLADRPTLRFADLMRHDLIGLHAISAWNVLMTRAAEEAGGVLKIRYRVTSFDAVCRMVAAGLGIALVPRGVVTTMDAQQMYAVPLDEPWSERELHIAVRAPDLLSSAARLLLEHLVRSATDVPSPDAMADLTLR